jgi:hypothetical protein
MKKKLILGILTLCLSSTASYAAPAYGTKMPAQGKLFGGLQNYFVDTRWMEGDNGKIRSNQEFFLLSYGLLDWLSIDLKGGAGDVRHSPSVENGVNYTAFVGGGYGFRMKIFDRDKFHSVWGFQHISIHPYSKGLEGNKHKGVTDDWQLSFLGSYDIGKWTPYAGFRWSRMDYIHWQNGERNRIKSDPDKSIGAIVGTDVNLTDRVWLNVEGDFVDAKAVACSVNYKF